MVPVVSRCRCSRSLRAARRRAFVPATAQPPGRVATTAAALRASPVFFHGKQVAVLGSVVESRGLYRLGSGAAAPRQPTSRPDLDEQADLRLLARAADAIRGRGSRRALGSRPPHRRRLAVLLGRLPAAPRAPDAADDGPAAIRCSSSRTPASSRRRCPQAATLRAMALAPETLREPQRQRLGPFPRPEPARRHRRAAPDARQMGLRAAVGRRRRLGQRAAAAGPGLRARSLGPRRHRPLGPGHRHRPARRQPRLDRSAGDRARGATGRSGRRSRGAGRRRRSRRRPSSSARPCPRRSMSTPATIVRVQFSRDMDARSFKDRIRVSYPPPPQAAAARRPPSRRRSRSTTTSARAASSSSSRGRSSAFRP